MKKLIAANWKMNKTVSEAVAAAKELKQLVKIAKEAEIVLCPSFTSLHAVAAELKNSSISLGAQNMHFESAGAYTGEISPVMLKDAGCTYVMLGHSERREFLGEDDILINKKLAAALKNSLKPVLCIGETAQQRSSGNTNEILESQLRICLKGISKEQMQNVAVAYEPVWAISRGNPNHKPATPEDAQQSHRFIRNLLMNIFDKSTAKSTRIIYGGSVKPDNARALFSMPDIDGALVGNASLDAKSFAEIVKAAAD